MKSSYQPEAKNCPICGNVADSPHHMCPLSQGGQDLPRNIILLCKRCHDVAEIEQELLGCEFSPDFADQLRRGLQVKLDEDEYGRSICYVHRDGATILSWMMLPGKTKCVINQPLCYVEKPEEEKKEPIPISLIPKEAGRRRGRPMAEEINTGYLEELVYNRGLSLRGASRQLLQEGFRMSYQGIKKRLMASNNYHPKEKLSRW